MAATPREREVRKANRKLTQLIARRDKAATRLVAALANIEAQRQLLLELRA